MKGFTTIEILIVVALIALVAAATFPLSPRFGTTNEHNMAVHQIVTNLRLAQQRSMHLREGDQWSVHFDDTAKTLTVFKGNDWSGRDISYDLSEGWPQNISVTPYAVDIVFNTYDGRPETSGVIQVTQSQTLTSKTITINSEGGITP